MIKKIKALFVKHKLLVYFLVVSAIILFTFRVWFFENSTLTIGDWWYYTNNSLKAYRLSYFSLWLGDQTFGRTIIDVGQAPTYAMYGFLAKYLGLSYAYGERMIHMLPAVIVAPLSSYFFLRLFTKKNISIAFGTAIFCCNTYFLQLLTGNITLATAYAFSPAILYTFITNFKNPSLRMSVIAGLLSFVMGSYEPRILYVLMIAIFLYIPFYLTDKGALKSIFKDIKSTMLRILPFILIILLSFYWLIGVYKLGGDTGGGVLSRSLFGNEYFKLVNSLTISQPYWTGYKPVSFVYHTISLNQWIIPVISCIGFYIARRNKLALYSMVLVLVGILLSKQTSDPFNTLYPWLYANIPGFNAFREGSKFYLLSALGFMGLGSLAIAKIISYRYKFPVGLLVTILLLCGLLYNLKPFANGDIQTTITARTSPEAYSIWNKYIGSKSEFSRVLWLPTASRWADNTFKHPNINGIDLSQKTWLPYNENDILPANGVITKPIQNQITDLYDSTLSGELLRSGDIKYVVIPLRDTANEDDFFQNYSNDRQHYINVVSALPYLKKIDIGTDELSVYQNLNYTNYASSSTSLVTINSLRSAGASAEFLKSISNKDVNFIEKDDNPTNNTDELTQLFIDTTKNFTNNTISTSLAVDNKKNNTAYINDARNTYSYSATNSELMFVKRDVDQVSINNSALPSGQPAQTQKISLDPNVKHVFSIANKLYDVDTSQKERNLGSQNSSIGLFSVNGDNLITNGSFDSGAWTKEVQDCSKYDNKAIISMAIDKENYRSFGSSIKLGSKNHIACTTSNEFSVESGGTLRLSYSYYLDGGQRAGYDIKFNDPQATTISADQTASNDSWYDVSEKINVPNNATRATLTLKAYADDHGVKYATTNYDDVSINRILLDANLKPETKPNYKAIRLSGNKIRLSINTPSSSTNGIKNNSFENGAWNKTVGDCNAYDDKPVLSMSISTKDSKDGMNSLYLGAKRHVACTSPDYISVAEGQSYSLSFDYKNISSNEAGYYLSFNDPKGTSYSERIRIDGNSWNTFSKNVIAPYGATEARLTIYSYPDDYSNSMRITAYDNFNFVATPNLENNYFVASNSVDAMLAPRSITSDNANQTEKRIFIKGAKYPFFLNLSETYNSNWQLNTTGAKNSTIASDLHYKLNGYLNAWYVNPQQVCAEKSSCSYNEDGTYDMELVANFTPQKYFNFGLLLSGGVLLICILYISSSTLITVKNRMKQYRE